MLLACVSMINDAKRNSLQVIAFFSASGVPLRHQSINEFLEQHLPSDTFLVFSERTDTAVGRAGTNSHYNVVRLGIDQMELNARVGFFVSGKHRRDDHCSQQGWRCNNKSAALAIGQIASTADRVLEIVDYLFGGQQKLATRASQLHTTRRAIQQANVELALKLAHRERHGRLGYLQALRGPRKAPNLSDRMKGFQLP